MLEGLFVSCYPVDASKPNVTFYFCIGHSSLVEWRIDILHLIDTKETFSNVGRLIREKEQTFCLKRFHVTYLWCHHSFTLQEKRVLHFFHFFHFACKMMAKWWQSAQLMKNPLFYNVFISQMYKGNGRCHYIMWSMQRHSIYTPLTGGWFSVYLY